jgi:hypothetical protein
MSEAKNESGSSEELGPGAYYRMPFAGPLKSVVVQVIGPGNSGHARVRSVMGHEFDCLLSSCYPFPRAEGDALFGIAQTLDEADLSGL